MEKGIRATIIITFIIVIGIILMFAFSSLYTIGAGERGVLLKFGNPDPVAKTEGLHFKLPIRDQVIVMDIKTQKYETGASAASKDLQTVNTNVAVNYHLTPDSVVLLYTQIGVGYQDRVIQPAVQEVVKAATAQYTAEELITKRALVKESIDTLLRERLGKQNILVETISITNFDFSESFNAAIEAKVTTEQNALTEKNKVAQIEYIAKQKIAEAEGNKQAAILEAQGKAEAIKIQAEAIRVQGGKEYVELQAIGKWQGNVPMYVSGANGGIVPFLNVPLGTTEPVTNAKA